METPLFISKKHHAKNKPLAFFIEVVFLPMLKLNHIALFILLISALTECKQETPISSNGTAMLYCPTSLTVGQGLNTRIQTKNIPKGEKIIIICQNSWGIDVIEKEIDNPLIQLIISKKFTRISGILSLKIVYLGKELATKTIAVLPRKTAEPLDAYLGSKSIIADGKDWAMITAIPTDTFGNPVKNHTPIFYELLRPDGTQQQIAATTENSVSFQKINSLTKAGKTFIGVSLNEVGSREKELLEVADFPVNFTIKADSHSIYADDHQFFKIKTSVLRDKNNNVMPEGTAVSFVCQEPSGKKRLLNSYTIEGTAELSIQNPKQAGTLKVVASVYGGGNSNTLLLDFISPIHDINVRYETTKQRVNVGPLIAQLNQLVPNGTQVSLVFDSNQYDSLLQEVVDGHVYFDFTDFPKGDYPVTIIVHGISKKIIVHRK